MLDITLEFDKRPGTTLQIFWLLKLLLFAASIFPL